MAKEPTQWDQKCRINIEWIGGHLTNRLAENPDEMDKGKLDDVCAMCFRFLNELYLSINSDLHYDFSSAMSFIEKNLDGFEEHAREQIVFAKQNMPTSLLKNLLNETGISSIKDFNNFIEETKKMKSEWKKYIDEKSEEVEQLKCTLENYKNAFNFVGLYKGFNELSQPKIDEKNTILSAMIILGIIITIPLIIEISYIYQHLKDIKILQEGLLIATIPTISIVAILIYYFKVLLSNYRSVKSQLLQIELRKSLCQFIQSYASYSSQINKDNPGSLEKFENVIFSGLIINEDKLPSTFDGVEQISKLIKSVKMQQ